MALDQSILNNTKKILGIAVGDSAFDTDVILYINGAFSSLSSLGVGPSGGFAIEDDSAVWSDFTGTSDEDFVNLTKMCTFSRVRLSFDPPKTSFELAALKEQMQEQEFRLSVLRESVSWVHPDPPVVIP